MELDIIRWKWMFFFFFGLDIMIAYLVESL